MSLLLPCCLLTLTALLPLLLTAFTRALLQRFRRAGETARPFERVLHPVGVFRALAECARSLAEALPHFVDAAGDIVLGGVNRLRASPRG